MARGGLSIGDVAYYGAIGGGGWLAFRLALAGQFGCSAYAAAAQAYQAATGKVPAAPLANSPAGQDSKCKSGLPGAAPSSSGSGSGASPTGGSGSGTPSYMFHSDGKCWQLNANGQPVQAVDVSQCRSAPPAATTLTDSDGFPVVWDQGAYAFRQDPSQGGTNTYGAGNFFIDNNNKQWTWVGPDAVLVSWDGSQSRSIYSFFR